MFIEQSILQEKMDERTNPRAIYNAPQRKSQEKTAGGVVTSTESWRAPNSREGRFDKSTTDPVEKRNAVLVDEAKRYVSGVQPDVMALIEARNIKYSDRKAAGQVESQHKKKMVPIMAPLSPKQGIHGVELPQKGFPVSKALEELQQNLDPEVLNDEEFKMNPKAIAKLQNQQEGSQEAHQQNYNSYKPEGTPPSVFNNNNDSMDTNQYYRKAYHSMTQSRHQAPYINQPLPINMNIPVPFSASDQDYMIQQYKNGLKMQRREQQKGSKFRSRSRKKKDVMYQDKLYEQLKQMGLKNPSNASFDTGEESNQQERRNETQHLLAVQQQIDQDSTMKTTGDYWMEQIPKSANMTPNNHQAAPKMVSDHITRHIGSSPSPFKNEARAIRTTQNSSKTQLKQRVAPYQHEGLLADIHEKRTMMQTQDNQSRQKSKIANQHRKQHSSQGQGRQGPSHRRAAGQRVLPDIGGHKMPPPTAGKISNQFTSAKVQREGDYTFSETNNPRDPAFDPQDAQVDQRTASKESRGGNDQFGALTTATVNSQPGGGLHTGAHTGSIQGQHQTNHKMNNNYNVNEPIFEKQRHNKTQIKGKLNSQRVNDQVTPTGGKIILKKINHFHDEKRIDMLYANQNSQIKRERNVMQKHSNQQQAQHTPRIKGAIDKTKQRTAKAGAVSSHDRGASRQTNTVNHIVDAPIQPLIGHAETAEFIHEQDQQEKLEGNTFGYTQQQEQRKEFEQKPRRNGQQNSSALIERTSTEKSPLAVTAEKNDQQRPVGHAQAAVTPQLRASQEHPMAMLDHVPRQNTEMMNEHPDDYGLDGMTGAGANADYELKVKKHKTMQDRKRKVAKQDTAKKRKNPTRRGEPYYAANNADGVTSMNDVVTRYFNQTTKRRDQLNYYQQELGYFQHQRQVSRIDKLEKSQKLRQKQRHRSAPKRDKQERRPLVMQQNEVIEAKPSAEQYPNNMGNNTARTQMDQAIRSKTMINHKTAMQTEDQRRPRIGDEQSIGSVFKPYPHRVSIDQNSIDRMGTSFISEAEQSPLNRSNKYFGKKSFSQTAGSQMYQNKLRSQKATKQSNSSTSELARIMQFKKPANRDKLELDAVHKYQLSFPESTQNPKLLIPEGMTSDPQKAMQNLKFNKEKTQLTKKASTSSLGASSDRSDSRDSRFSHQKLKERAMNYKFQLQDIGKYSSKLKFKDLNWKLCTSALGKEIPDDAERRKTLLKESYFNKLARLLRNTDWSRTPVFHQFQRNGRWKHEDPNIYGENEIKYLQTSLLAMKNQDNQEEFAATEGVTILNKHFEKTMHTLEVLMNQMNMMFYWERLKYYFHNNEPTLESLSKLMSRILKLYLMIDNFMKIFRMIKKKEKLEGQLGKGSRIDETIQKVDQVLRQRLQVSIKMLLKENPMLPKGLFSFQGSNLVEKYRQEEKGHIQTEYSKMIKENPSQDELSAPSIDSPFKPEAQEIY